MSIHGGSLTCFGLSLCRSVRRRGATQPPVVDHVGHDVARRDDGHVHRRHQVRAAAACASRVHDERARLGDGGGHIRNPHVRLEVRLEPWKRPPLRDLAPRLNALLSSCATDSQITQKLTGSGFAVDYIVSRHGRRFAAASLDCGDHAVRLIDNVELN